jgi:hypothetical protein
LLALDLDYIEAASQFVVIRVLRARCPHLSEETMLRKFLPVPTLAVIATLVALTAFKPNQSSGAAPPTHEIKSAQISVVGGNTGVVEVLCPSGKKALGGGFQIEGGVLIAGPDVAVYESSPRVTSGKDGWRLEAANRGTTTRMFDVWVVCGSV